MATLSLNEGGWNCSCPSLEHDPLEDLSLPAYPLSTLCETCRIDNPLEGYAKVAVAWPHTYGMVPINSCECRYNEERLRWTALETWSFWKTFDIFASFSTAIVT